MKPVVTFGILLVVVFLTVSCSGTPTPDAAATAAAATAVAAAVSSPTPAPTNTPVPTNTPAPTPTSAPTDTPLPPTATEAPPPPAVPTDTPMPTDTPVPEMLPAPQLLAPNDGDTFAGIATDVTFSWSPAPRPLAEDEYYVLLITHGDGTDYTWTKDTSFSISQNKNWMSELGPAYKWQVVVAQRSADQPEDNPAGRETSAYSLVRACFWNI